MTGRVLMLVWTSVSTDTRVLREARALVDAGWSVHIIGRAVPSDFVASPGISVSSVGTAPAAQSRIRQLNVVERAARWLLLPEHVGRRLAAWQRDAVTEAGAHRADVVHAHDFSALPVGAELAKAWGVPLVYDSHELWSGRPRVGRPTPVKARREARLEATLGQGAAIVLTVGEGVAGALRDRYGWSDVRVVRNTFPRAQAPEERLGGPTAAVYAGRLAPYRELEVIARASGLTDLPITLIGPSDAQFVSRFDPGRATIRDSLPADEVDAVLAAAGLALVTHSDQWVNHRLALPNKLFHAVRAGVPVVATDVGELAAMVREHDLGELYRPGDSDDLVRAIDRAVARYQELRANIRRAAGPLSWDADSQGLVDAYASLQTDRSQMGILSEHQTKAERGFVSSQAISPEDEYLGEHHVYEPHRAGLPKMRPYFRELWRRKSFAFELTHTEMHAANTDTFFGQAWLVINPLLLASVYFVLVEIISNKPQAPTFFAHLTSGIFLFYFISGSMLSGASSVVSGGRLIMNTSFPKMLLPISSCYTAFRRFLPTLLVYAVLHLVAHLPIGLHLLWAFVVLIEAACFALGLAMLFATAQVYFRDTKSFLPYGVRIWLYLTPVLWFADKAPHKLLPFLPFNPLYGIMGSWSQVLIEGKPPATTLILLGAAWSLATLVVGGLFFMSREREFAVRI